MKWKYYENHKIGDSARILIVGRVLRIVSWPATKGFQLAPRQRRKRAAGPCELSHGADLSHLRKRRKYSGGYQGRKADHDILDARGGMEGSAAASRGHRQPAATVPARTRCGNTQTAFPQRVLAGTVAAGWRWPRDAAALPSIPPRASRIS